MSKEYDERLHTPEAPLTGREMAQREMSQQEMTHDQERMQQEQSKMHSNEPMHSRESAMHGESEPLAALFPPDVAQDFRSRWDAIQIGFVDDPRQAVQRADELVEQVMRSLTQTFTRHRAGIEAGVRESEQASTENLRTALRDYRSFFQRLLSL